MYAGNAYVRVLCSDQLWLRNTYNCIFSLSLANNMGIFNERKPMRERIFEYLKKPMYSTYLQLYF